LFLIRALCAHIHFQLSIFNFQLFIAPTEQ